MELTVNGRKDTLAYHESKSIKGECGILVQATARSIWYKSSSQFFGVTSQSIQTVINILVVTFGINVV